MICRKEVNKSTSALRVGHNWCGFLKLMYCFKVVYGSGQNWLSFPLTLWIMGGLFPWHLPELSAKLVIIGSRGTGLLQC